MGSTNYDKQLYNNSKYGYLESLGKYEFINCHGLQGSLKNSPFYMRNCRYCVFNSNLYKSKYLGIKLAIRNSSDFDAVFFILHEKTDNPVFDGTFDHISYSKKNLSITLISYLKFQSYKSDTSESYNQCNSKCLSQSLLTRDKIAKIELGKSFIFTDHEILECRKKCEFHPYSILTSVDKKVLATKSQITTVFLIPNEEECEIQFEMISVLGRPKIIYEKTGLSFIEMTNEIGTIIGFCFGLSLISFGRYIRSTCSLFYNSLMKKQN